MFGVQPELVELIKIQCLTARQARLLFDAGFPNLTAVATADRADIRKVLMTPFNRCSKVWLFVRDLLGKILLVKILFDFFS